MRVFFIQARGRSPPVTAPSMSENIPDIAKSRGVLGGY